MKTSRQLNNNIVIASDEQRGENVLMVSNHVSFAIGRHQKGLTLGNALL